jgi:broad specificity phosphatase PhoE
VTSDALRDASLVLVRHGRTTWVEEGRFQGAADVPLSAHGRAQAAAVGARLADPHAAPALPVPGGAPTVIRHSPLSRAADTAGAIARARGTPDSLVADADLREIAQGAWEGLRHEEVRIGWARDLALWRHDPINHHAPGGESLQEASARASRAVGRMLADVGAVLVRAPDEERSSVLGYAEPPGPGAAPVVAEHDPWSITVAHDGILRLVLLCLLELPLDSYWSFPFALCGIDVIEIRSGRARVRAHNLEEHLASVAAADSPAGVRSGAR